MVNYIAISTIIIDMTGATIKELKALAWREGEDLKCLHLLYPLDFETQYTRVRNSISLQLK